jgi:hypothetical protein
LNKRVKGKGLVDPCCICGENRVTDGAHFPKRQRDGGEITIPLCPTHHKLLDNGRISMREIERLRKNCFEDKFKTAEELIKWAHEEGYPYSLEVLKEKFWIM